MTPIVKRSFNGGEVSPTLWQRTDVDKVQSGCRLLKNFLVHAHGAVYRRPGIRRWAVISTTSS